MTGPEASSVLRSKNIHIPIIGVTGNVLQEDKDFYISNGANAVLHKPLTIVSLQMHINKLNVIKSNEVPAVASSDTPVEASSQVKEIDLEGGLSSDLEEIRHEEKSKTWSSFLER